MFRAAAGQMSLAEEDNVITCIETFLICRPLSVAAPEVFSKRHSMHLCQRSLVQILRQKAHTEFY